jgi:hypothetical protein
MTSNRTVCFLTTRRDGCSLGDMIRSGTGPVAGANAGTKAGSGDCWFDSGG